MRNVQLLRRATRNSHPRRLTHSKQTIEIPASLLADIVQRLAQRALVQLDGRPLLHQARQYVELRLRGRKTALGMSGGDPLAVIEGAVERGRLAQEVGVRRAAGAPSSR